VNEEVLARWSLSRQKKKRKKETKETSRIDEDSYYINMFPLAAFFLDVNNASIKRNTNFLLPLHSSLPLNILE